MKPLLFLLSLIFAPAQADSGACAPAPPSDWIDPATGHRVIRLSGDGGGSSLYFH
jgi:oligogalacturonide lyase